MTEPTAEEKEVEHGSDMVSLLPRMPGMKQPILCPEYDPEALTEDTSLVVCRGGQKRLSSVILHLNDHHRWSREEIADWLDLEAEKGSINIDFGEQLTKDGNTCH